MKQQKELKDGGKTPMHASLHKTEKSRRELWKGIATAKFLSKESLRFYFRSQMGSLKLPNLETNSGGKFLECPQNCFLSAAFVPAGVPFRSGNPLEKEVVKN